MNVNGHHALRIVADCVDSRFNLTSPFLVKFSWVTRQLSDTFLCAHIRVKFVSAFLVFVAVSICECAETVPV